MIRPAANLYTDACPQNIVLSVGFTSQHSDAALGSMKPLGRRRGAALLVKLSDGDDMFFGHASFLCFQAGKNFAYNKKHFMTLKDSQYHDKVCATPNACLREECPEMDGFGSCQASYE